VRAKNDLFRIDQKGGLTGTATATVATPATQKVGNPATVAPVAVAKQTEPLPELTPEEELNIRACLARLTTKQRQPEIDNDQILQHRQQRSRTNQALVRMLDFSPPAEAEWYGTYYFLSSEAIAPKIVPRPSHQVWVTKCPPRYKRTLTKYDG